jgi:hypothetical protein
MTPLGVSIAATIASLTLLVAVLELVRRRRLREKYALLWIVTSVVLLVLSVWRDAVDQIAGLVGVSYAPAIIFAIAVLFILVVLLHYSTVVSTLADRTVTLSQQNAILSERIDRIENATQSETTKKDSAGSGT